MSAADDALRLIGDACEQAMLEIAAANGQATCGALYLAAVARARILQVPVAEVMFGRTELLMAAEEIEAVAARIGSPTCTDLEEWLRDDKAAWVDVLHRAEVLLVGRGIEDATDKREAAA